MKSKSKLILELESMLLYVQKNMLPRISKYTARLIRSLIKIGNICFQRPGLLPHRGFRGCKDILILIEKKIM